jgi:hypothetical protein
MKSAAKSALSEREKEREIEMRELSRAFRCIYKRSVINQKLSVFIQLPWCKHPK